MYFNTTEMLLWRLRRAWRANTIYEYVRHTYGGLEEFGKFASAHIVKWLDAKWQVEVTTQDMVVFKKAEIKQFMLQFEFDDDSDNPNDWKISNVTEYDEKVCLKLIEGSIEF